MPCPCQTRDDTPNQTEYIPPYPNTPNEDFYSDERMANQPLYIPGECAPLDTYGLLIGGIIVGGIGALFLANMTGTTSLFGIGSRVKHAAGHTYRSAKKTFK